MPNPGRLSVGEAERARLVVAGRRSDVPAAAYAADIAGVHACVGALLQARIHERGRRHTAYRSCWLQGEHCIEPVC